MGVFLSKQDNGSADHAITGKIGTARFAYIKYGGHFEFYILVNVKEFGSSEPCMVTLNFRVLASLCVLDL